MTKQNLIISLLSLCLITLTGFFAKAKINEFKNNKLKSALNEEIMKANLEIGKAETRFGETKDYIKDLEDIIANDIEDNKSLVTKYGDLEAKYNFLSKGKADSVIKVIKTVNFDDCKDLKLKEGRLYVVKNKKLGEMAPFKGDYKDHHIGISCRINPGVSSTGSISLDIAYDLELNLKVEMLETVSPGGAVNNYINIYEMDKDGKEIKKLEINKYSVVVQDKRSLSFSLWNPRIDLALGFGIQTNTSLKDMNLNGGASIGLSLSSYGLPKEEPTWKFLRGSLDIGEEISIGFSPALYNIGKDIPLFNNLWIGGFTHYGLSSKKTSLGLLLGASL